MNVSMCLSDLFYRASVNVAEHCKKPLDDYLATHFDGKVKVVHQARREGLIRTRLTGAKAATGQVLIFLDSHVEANINWLPPLLGLLWLGLFYCYIPVPVLHHSHIKQRPSSLSEANWH